MVTRRFVMSLIPVPVVFVGLLWLSIVAQTDSGAGTSSRREGPGSLRGLEGYGSWLHAGATPTQVEPASSEAPAVGTSDERGSLVQASPNSSRSKRTMSLPNPGLEIDRERTAIVITDPQVDFLSPEGVTWGVVGDSVTENDTVANLERLLDAAKDGHFPVFVSPHYYYPHDHQWRFAGSLEKLMHDIHMFDRLSALSLEGFEGSGADWLDRYKPYIHDGETVVCSPHKVFGPQTNDLVLQLRKRGIDKVVLAGMSANLCVESHLRELLEQGFEVAAVSDATAGARVPEGDGYAAAMTNFRFLASAVWTTRQAVAFLRAADEAVAR